MKQMKRLSAVIGWLVALALHAGGVHAGVFTPGDVYWTSMPLPSDYIVADVINVTGGGDLTGASPLATIGKSLGQLAWSADRTTMYAAETYDNQVVSVSDTGVVSAYATGLGYPTGLLLTQDGRLLAATVSGGVYDITGGGDFSGATPLATGFGFARNMVQLQDGRILLVDRNLRTDTSHSAVFDITSGGDFSSATSGFAWGLKEAIDIVQDASGRIFVSEPFHNINGVGLGHVVEVTSGGDFTSAPRFASGREFIGLTVDAEGRLLASAYDSNNVWDITAGGSGTSFASVPHYGETGLDTVPALPEPALTTDPADGGTKDAGYTLVKTGTGSQIIVQNTGDPGSTLTGTFPAASGEFTPGTTESFSVAEGDSDLRTYFYWPTSRGADSQDITITSDGGDSTITLQGSGVAPVSSVNDGGKDVGYVLVGETKAAWLNVSNVGDGNLSGLGSTSNLHGSTQIGAGDFTRQGSGAIDIGDGSTTTVAYTYAPSSRGADSLARRLDFTNGSPDETNSLHTHDFTLTGTGVAPVVQATCTGAGLVRVGTSGTCSVTIQNIGDGNLSGLGDPSDLHGTLGAMSSVFTGAGGSFDLGDGESISYNYSYDPLGRRYDSEGNPCSTSNGSPDGTNQAHAQSMTLTGQAVGPVFDSSVAVGSTIDFGAVTFGDTAMRFLDIMNVSDDPNGDDTTLTDLTLRWLGVTGPDASAFTIVGIPVGTELDQLDVETLGITFTSSGPQGERTATLEIRTDEGAPLGGDGEVFTFGLRGYATGASTVPEPATFSLLGLAALALARRRRR